MASIKIDSIGEKISLLLRSDRFKIKREVDLKLALGIEDDYFTRIKNGTRPLSESIFIKLCNVFGIEQRRWFDSLAAFGEYLGYSRFEIISITGSTLPGFDFHSRIKDRDTVDKIFEVIGGFWESYYYSVSRLDEVLISKDLVHIERVSPDMCMNCSVHDGHFSYKGLCFPIKNHLCFLLEKEKLFNEVIFYLTNLPDRDPPKLNGVILCLSGGVDEFASYPAASYVAFRYLGSSHESVSKHYPSIDGGGDLLRELKMLVPGYVSPSNPAYAEIARTIDNSINKKSRPFALRMNRT